MATITYCDKCDKKADSKIKDDRKWNQIMMLGRFNWHFCPECTDELEKRIVDFLKKDLQKQ